MNKCPKCGRNMAWHLLYKFGQAHQVYTCVCGYNSGNIRYNTNNRTKIISNISYTYDNKTTSSHT